MRGACGYCSSDRICLLASASAAACRAQARDRAHVHIHACAYRDILTLPCLAFPYLTRLTYTYSLALWRFLSLRRYTANGISRMALPILVACRLSSLPERCTSLHRFVAALDELWQLLAALGRAKTQGPPPGPQGRPGKASAIHRSHTTRRRHNRTIVPPSGLKEPNNGNLAYGAIWGWPDLPKRAYELLNIYARRLCPQRR